jgi:hypothetical protein
VQRKQYERKEGRKEGRRRRRCEGHEVLVKVALVAKGWQQ